MKLKIILLAFVVVSILSCSKNFEIDSVELLKKELNHNEIQLDLVNNSFYRFRIYNYPVDTSNFELLAPKFIQASDLIKKNTQKKTLKTQNSKLSLHHLNLQIYLTKFLSVKNFVNKNYC